uniref:Uncharacterized protein n=1 Tax=Rhizophora mucronata TaxID=61149 RepID=A0A2P2L2J5_RHIMU
MKRLPTVHSHAKLDVLMDIILRVAERICHFHGLMCMSRILILLWLPKGQQMKVQLVSQWRSMMVMM